MIISIEEEKEINQMWEFEAYLLSDDHNRKTITLLLPFYAYSKWCPDASLRPSEIALAVLKLIIALKPNLLKKNPLYLTIIEHYEENIFNLIPNYL